MSRRTLTPVLFLCSTYYRELILIESPTLGYCVCLIKSPFLNDQTACFTSISSTMHSVPKSYTKASLFANVNFCFDPFVYLTMLFTHLTTDAIKQRITSKCFSFEVKEDGRSLCAGRRRLKLPHSYLLETKPSRFTPVATIIHAALVTDTDNACFTASFQPVCRTCQVHR